MKANCGCSHKKEKDEFLEQDFVKGLQNHWDAQISSGLQIQLLQIQNLLKMENKYLTWQEGHKP